jgi:hypothetical protein
MQSDSVRLDRIETGEDIAVSRNGESALLRRQFWAVFLLIFAGRTVAADDDLEMLRAAHRQARQSIRTFSATVTAEHTLPQKAVIMQASYWRSLDMVRVHCTAPDNNSTDFLSKDSEVRRVFTYGDKPGRTDFRAGRFPKSNVLGLTDVWSQMLIEFHGHDGGQYDFDRFIGLAKAPPRLARARLNGIDCVRLKMSIPNGERELHYVLWHDISRNYLVRKIEITFSQSPDKSEAENVEFIEPSPGIFVPVRCIRRSTTQGRSNESATTLSDVEVNKPIAPSVFLLPAIPSGTILDDKISRTTYPVDSEWRKIGPEEPLVELKVAAPSSETPSYFAPSTREPRSLWWWLVYASLAVFVVSGVLWCWRYRERARAENEHG